MLINKRVKYWADSRFRPKQYRIICKYLNPKLNIIELEKICERKRYLPEDLDSSYSGKLQCEQESQF